MIIFGSLSTTFEASVIFEAVGGLGQYQKFSQEPKPP